MAAGDQVQFVPQTVEQAYLARKETNEKVALLRQRAAGQLLDDAAVLKAFQVRPCTLGLKDGGPGRSHADRPHVEDLCLPNLWARSSISAVHR